LPLGALGVQLFFALSGFLISRILLRELDGTGSINLFRFMGRRALRIFPAFYVFLAVIAVLILARWIVDTNWRSFLAAALYISNWRGSSATLGHTWSLSIEEQYYALWPATMLVIPRRHLLRGTFLIIALIVVWRAVAIILQQWPMNSSVFYERSDFRFDSLLVGAVIAQLPERAPLSRRITLSLVGIGTLAFAASPAMLLSAPLRPFALTTTTFLAGLIVFCVVRGSGGTFAPLRLAGLRWLGRVSYSLYLWQQPVLLGTIGGLTALRGVPALGLVFLCGLASYRWVEQPFLVFRSKIGRLR
jgi:peptidoglycan/LPS O-acetylase OafA/YrhL